MRRGLLTVCVTALTLSACRAAAPEPRREQQLKDSFVRQIAASGIVRDLQRDGDTVSFRARHVDELDAKWRVHIDAASIEPDAGGKGPDKGLIKSSWYVNEEPIPPRGDQSDLPLPFLDAGIAQECWALWDSTHRQWSWK